MKLESDTNSEMLLSEPGKFLPGEKFDRPSVEVTTLEKFDSRKLPRQFSRQYCHSYSVRLWSMRPKLEELVAEEWPGVSLKKIAELCEFTQAVGSSSSSKNVDDKSAKGKQDVNAKGRNSDDHGQHIAFREDITVAIIGTVFKQQPEKPSILQELAEENPMIPIVPKTKYTSDQDKIQMEDETSRVYLVPSENSGLTVGGIVNGVICAVKGKPNKNGKFEVVDVLFPSPKPCHPLETPKLNGDMVFISGLEFGSDMKSLALKIDILFDTLEGLSGCPSEDSKLRTKVFFVGNTVAKFSDDDNGNPPPNKIEIMKRLDRMLDDLSRTMDVFILPGENDPSEPTLPQFPIHHCVLPLTSRRQTFTALTNPARIEIPVSKDKDNKAPQLDVILSSGQNVMDAMRNSETPTAVEMAENILRWGHLCPTAPDTLPLHPGVEDDVFIIDILPHIFVVGNQPSFDALEYRGTSVITVPKFSESGVVVVFNKDMEVVPLMISG